MASLLSKPNNKFSTGGLLEHEPGKEPAYRLEMWCHAGAAPGQHLEANATYREVMRRVDQLTQIAAKPVQLPNETDRGPEERLLNLLAQGQALTRTS
jgi:hypothetical protein